MEEKLTVLSFIEARVLAVLIEKAHTTPDLVPLSLNSCMLGCNQSSNREPVTHFSEDEVQAALEELILKKLVLRVHAAGARAIKYNHRCDSSWNLSREALCLLSILMLRGEQTPGELSTRCKRSCPDLSLEGVQATLAELAGGAYPMVQRLERQPGQKEARWRCLLLEGDIETSTITPTDHSEIQDLRDEVQFLRNEVDDLRAELAELKAQLS